MPHLPDLTPSELNDEQKPLYDSLMKEGEQFCGKIFQYKNKDGSMCGPFNSLLYTPSLALPYFNTVKELGRHSELSPTARETVILAVGAHYKAAYELYAHARVAVASTNLSQSQVDTIVSGEKPQGLDEESSIAYDIAQELVRKPGPLSKESWSRGEKALGRQKMLQLIHYCGYYAYTCILLNGCDVPVPGEHFTASL